MKYYDGYYGCMGNIDGEYKLFATDAEYYEYLEGDDEDGRIEEQD